MWIAPLRINQTILLAHVVDIAIALCLVIVLSSYWLIFKTANVLQQQDLLRFLWADIVPPCGKQFSKRGNLIKHQREVHEGVKYSWRQCGRLFSRKGNLAEHQKTVHEGVKYPCTQCNYQAPTKGSVIGHQRVVRTMQPSINFKVKSCKTQKGIT